MEVQDYKLIIDEKELIFEDKIIEANLWKDKIFVVFQTDNEDRFDNLYCYDVNKTLL